MKNLYLYRRSKGTYYISNKCKKRPLIVENIQCYEIPEGGREIGSGTPPAPEAHLEMIIKVINQTLETFKPEKRKEKYNRLGAVEQIIEARLNAWQIPFSKTRLIGLGNRRF